MSANITGYAIYQGLATSLDTLCAQAYGSGHKTLVGLQMQRMVYFLWAVTIPIAIIWLSADRILMRIVPEKEVARETYTPSPNLSQLLICSQTLPVAISRSPSLEHPDMHALRAESGSCKRRACSPLRFTSY